MVEEEKTFNMQEEGKKIVISNYSLEEVPEGEITLRPYEAFVVKLSEKQ